MNWSRLRQPAFLVAMTVLTIGAVGMGSAIKMAKIYLDKRPIYPKPIDGKPHKGQEGGPTLLALPIETRNWKQVGQDRVETEEIEEELGTSNYLNRYYAEKNPPPGRNPRIIDFHAAYYTDQIDTVPHVPDRCFVGGGMQIGSAAKFLPLGLDPSRWREDVHAPEKWRGQIVQAKTSNDSAGRGRLVRLPRNPGDIEMKVMEFFPKEGGKPIYAGYFFIANGGTVARAEQVRLLAFNLTDDYAYYLKVQFTSDQVASAEELRDAGTSLMNDLLPELMLCIPDWVEVDTGLWPPDNPRAKGRTTPVASQAGSDERR
jgi:hypothetical protein